jgi:hypothetical protein
MPFLGRTGEISCGDGLWPKIPRRLQGDDLSATIVTAQIIAEKAVPDLHQID